MKSPCSSFMFRRKECIRSSITTSWPICHMDWRSPSSRRELPAPRINCCRQGQETYYRELTLEESQESHAILDERPAKRKMKR